MEIRRHVDEGSYSRALSWPLAIVIELRDPATLWFKDHDLVRPLAESFVGQNPERYTTFAIQTAFEYLENTCMQPEWWEGEKPAVRNLLVERMQRGGNSFDERKADCLTFCGVGFDQWEYDRHEFLNADEAEEMPATSPSVEVPL